MVEQVETQKEIDERLKLSVTVRIAEREELRDLCKKKGITISSVIQKLVASFMRRQKK